MGRTAVAVVGLALLASALAMGPSAGAPVAETALAQPDGFDRTVFDVAVDANGTAEWAFEHRRILDNETEERDFQAYADTFESSETPLYRDFVNQSEALARVGSQQTDREMTARDHERSASVDSLGQTEGVVRLSVEWTNFAEETDGGVVVADVFEGGLVLGENQRIVFERGEHVAFEDVQPDDYTPSGANLSTSGSVTFFGPRGFADRRPRVELGPRGGTGGPAGGSGMGLAILAGIVVVTLGAVAALAWRYDLLPGTESETDPSDAGNASAQPAPPELTSDSDQVLELLERNGGRMKQVNIVEETDWSKSKVSMLLSDMEDEGEITKLRVGRENIVSLAGHEPDAAGSPFEERE